MLHVLQKDIWWITCKKCRYPPKLWCYPPNIYEYYQLHLCFIDLSRFLVHLLFRIPIIGGYIVVILGKILAFRIKRSVIHQMNTDFVKKSFNVTNKHFNCMLHVLQKDIWWITCKKCRYPPKLWCYPPNIYEYYQLHLCFIDLSRFLVHLLFRIPIIGGYIVVILGKILAFTTKMSVIHQMNTDLVNLFG